MLIPKNKFLEEPEEPFDPQDKSSYSQEHKIKNKRNYCVTLHGKTFNHQLAKRIESTRWMVYDSETSKHIDPFRTFAKTRRSQSKTRELELFLAIHAHIQNQCLFFLTKALKNVQFLKKIDMYFGSYCRITDKGLEALSQGLKRAFGVKTLILRFRFDSNEITDFGVRKVSQSLARLTSLESLTLEIGGSNQITSNSLGLIANSVRKLKSLSRINLRFRKLNNIDEYGLSCLRKSLIKLDSLEGLDIDFFACKQWPETGVLDLCGNLESLKSLTSLGLRFQCCDFVSDRVLPHFSKCLQGIIANLNKLILDFGYCTKVTGAGFYCFFQGFKNLIKLQNMSLRFSSCNKTLIPCLSKALENMPNVKSLHLKLSQIFYRPCLTTIGLGILSRSLSTLKALRNIHLNFKCESEVNNEGATSICKALSQLPLLLSLKLLFESCSQITEKGLGDMSQHLKNLTGLRMLDLGFSNCAKISDLGLEFLAKNLRNIILLQELNLCFSRCTEITDASLRNLSQDLENRSDLIDLHLDFSCCPQLTDAGLIVLGKDLKKYPALKKASIWVFSCEKITKDTLESVNKELEPQDFRILA